jgi:hypothetical protein
MRKQRDKAEKDVDFALFRMTLNGLRRSDPFPPNERPKYELRRFQSWYPNHYSPVSSLMMIVQ